MYLASNTCQARTWMVRGTWLTEHTAAKHRTRLKGERASRRTHTPTIEEARHNDEHTNKNPSQERVQGPNTNQDGDTQRLSVPSPQHPNCVCSNLFVGKIRRGESRQSGVVVRGGVHPPTLSALHLRNGGARQTDRVATISEKHSPERVLRAFRRPVSTAGVTVARLLRTVEHVCPPTGPDWSKLRPTPRHSYARLSPKPRCTQITIIGETHRRAFYTDLASAVQGLTWEITNKLRRLSET